MVPNGRKRWRAGRWDDSYWAVSVTDLTGNEFYSLLEVTYEGIKLSSLDPNSVYDQQEIANIIATVSDLYLRDPNHRITWDDLAQEFGQRPQK